MSPCGCQSVGCGCNIQAGAGIAVQRIGDTFHVSATGLPALTGAVTIVRGFWDYDVDGGAVGTIPLRGEDGNPLVIPEGDIIVNTLVRVLEDILPGELDPAAGGAEIQFAGGSAQFGFLQGTPVDPTGESVQTNGSVVGRSF